MMSSMIKSSPDSKLATQFCVGLAMVLTVAAGAPFSGACPMVTQLS